MFNRGAVGALVAAEDSLLAAYRCQCLPQASVFDVCELDEETIPERHAPVGTRDQEAQVDPAIGERAQRVAQRARAVLHRDSDTSATAVRLGPLYGAFRRCQVSLSSLKDARDQKEARVVFRFVLHGVKARAYGALGATSIASSGKGIAAVGSVHAATNVSAATPAAAAICAMRGY